ncbi:hypothetical protein [Lutibaculum baratangense]|nr:hypothetical protein [Lutibaculum baratangense]
MKASEFEPRFNEAEDMSDHIDWSRARRPDLDPKHTRSRDRAQSQDEEAGFR